MGPVVSPAAPSAASAADAYAELAKIVLRGQPLGAVLGRVAQLAQGLIPAAADVSVTLVDRGRARTVAFSGPLAAMLDERQYERERGPCLDAAVTGDVIFIEDTATNRIYPEFARQAARAGVHQSLAVGLPVIAQGVTGALNVYGTGDSFTDRTHEASLGFASYALVAITNAAAYAGAVEESDQLRAAMASRAVIEQAKGIIMAQKQCDSQEAFHFLRETSNRANLKLRDVAQGIVDDVVR
jgi:GAF domain-containing protein